MDKREIVKRYGKDGFDIIWKPAKCIHAEICVKTLPGVYKPGDKPWIQPESATVSDLKAQIDRCPSGALSFETDRDESRLQTEIQATQGGPLIVKGAISLTKPDGSVQTMEGNTAFCRCGASSNKPLCDGSHRKVTFE